LQLDRFNEVSLLGLGGVLQQSFDNRTAGLTKGLPLED